MRDVLNRIESSSAETLLESRAKIAIEMGILRSTKEPLSLAGKVAAPCTQTKGDQTDADGCGSASVANQCRCGIWPAFEALGEADAGSKCDGVTTQRPCRAAVDGFDDALQAPYEAIDGETCGLRPWTRRHGKSMGPEMAYISCSRRTGRLHRSEPATCWRVALGSVARRRRHSSQRGRDHKEQSRLHMPPSRTPLASRDIKGSSVWRDFVN